MEPILDMFLDECMEPNMATYIREGMEVLLLSNVDVSDAFLDLAYKRDSLEPDALVESMLSTMDECLVTALKNFGIYMGEEFDRHSLMLMVKLLFDVDDLEYDETAVNILSTKVYDEEMALYVFTEFLEFHLGRVAERWIDDIDRVQISTITRLREIYERIHQRTAHRQDEILSMIELNETSVATALKASEQVESSEWKSYVRMMEQGFLSSQGLQVDEALTLINTFAIFVDYPSGLPFETNHTALGKYINHSPNINAIAAFYLYLAMISKEWKEQGLGLFEDPHLLDYANMEEEVPGVRLALFKAAVKVIMGHFDVYKARYEKA